MSRVDKILIVLIILLPFQLTITNAKELKMDFFKKYFIYVNENNKERLFELFHKEATIIDVNREIKGKENIITWLNNEVLGGKYIIKDSNIDSINNKAEFIIVFTLYKWKEGFLAKYEFKLKDGKIYRANLQYTSSEKLN